MTSKKHRNGHGFQAIGLSNAVDRLASGSETITLHPGEIQGRKRMSEPPPTRKLTIIAKDPGL
ncbi:hypothetical protein ACE4ZU_26495, partial [Salmonella enterica]|uniref:hypothetical protein n=1 Tax=Salmonella enterica TaxID=28901 RepID=UPI003D28AAC4